MNSDEGIKLPIPLTSFIGREKELRELHEVLGTARLLTLTGAGGSGKTRLAIQVARETMPDFAHGVWWVDLAGLRAEALVPQAVMQALGVGEAPNQTPTETLTYYLETKQLLLVIDNCEHLIATCARLAETLLTECAELKILATSREALNVGGETVYHVLMLATPDLSATLAELMGYESVRLFVERAKGVKSDFALTEQNAGPVSQICRRLDGIPLALELAAARTKLLSVEHLAARLDDRFTLLTGGSRTALPRQQTLSATIDWSYDLLPESVQKLFRRLSVFAGGFTLEAAEHVCSDEELASEQVLDELGRLVDRSLVVVESKGEAMRYRMLETIREYARKNLLKAEEFVPLQDKHLHFFIEWASKFQQFPYDEKQLLDYLEPEHDNVRAALAWSLEHRLDEAGLQLGTAMWWFWQVRGYWTEGAEWLRQLLENTHDGLVSRQTRMYALRAAAGLAWRMGKMDLAIKLCGECLPPSQEFGKREVEAFCNGTLGAVAWSRGDLQASRAFHEKALRIRQELGDKAQAAYSLGNLAMVYWSEGDLAQAVKHADESLALAREAESQWQTAEALGRRATVARAQGDFELAYALYRESLALRHALLDRVGIAFDLEGIAALATNNGSRRAARLWGAAEHLRQEASALLMPSLQNDYAPLIAEARRRIGATAFNAAWAEGETLTLVQAIDYALAEGDDTMRTTARTAKQEFGGLTARERAVTALIARGKSNRAIAEELVVEVKTVEAHITRILSKLGFNSRVQIASWAISKGLAEAPEDLLTQMHKR